MKIPKPTGKVIIFVLANLAFALSLQEDNFVQILKCCSEGFILSNSQGCKRNDTTQIRVPVYKTDHVTKDDSITATFDSHERTCDTLDEESFWFLPQFSDSERFFVQSDGRLWVPQNNTSFSTRQFCLDHFEGIGIIAAVCIPGFQIVIDKISAEIFLIGMFISLPFLLTTFVIYSLLPERSFYGKCLMSYVFSLFWAYCLPIFYYIYGQFTTFNLLACRIIVIVFTFFFICSFFWMNVIAFDIWLTFSGNKGDSNNESNRFIKYSIYAWGVPVFMMILLIVLSITTSPSTWYSPFGEGRFLQEGLPSLLYFYAPMGILLAINIALFVSTARKIVKTRKQTAILREGGNETHNSEDEAATRFKVFVKLMFAMGINWSVEFIKWAVTWQIGPFPFLWYLTDFCNAGLGMLIFFMFVYNKTTWKLLKKRTYDLFKTKAESIRTHMTSFV